ncbi:MAG: DUF4249 domain-containing protein [Deltaproteobacteria bacterium]
MKINSFTLIILSFILFSSCEDVFTSIKEIEIPDHENKLAVFAELSDDKGVFSVSYSKIITDNQSYIPQDAEITVLENGSPFFKFSFKGYDKKSFDSINLSKKIKEGNEYELIVENDKYGKATAKQIVPLKPDFYNLKYKKDGYLNNDGYKSDLFSFDLNDDPNNENYYLIELSGIYDNNIFENRLYADSEDPSLKNFYFYNRSGLIVSDKNFDGSQIKILTYFIGYESLSKIKLRLYSITKDYYHFLLSYDQYSDSKDNPFAEPVNIHSNIQNGYGMFQVSSYKESVLDIE